MPTAGSKVSSEREWRFIITVAFVWVGTEQLTLAGLVDQHVKFAQTHTRKWPTLGRARSSTASRVALGVHDDVVAAIDLGAFGSAMNRSAAKFGHHSAKLDGSARTDGRRPGKTRQVRRKRDRACAWSWDQAG